MTQAKWGYRIGAREPIEAYSDGSDYITLVQSCEATGEVHTIRLHWQEVPMIRRWLKELVGEINYNFMLEE